MELDELKGEWATLERRLVSVEATLSAQRRRGVRAELRPLVVWQVAQILLGVCLALGAGSFWFDHRDQANLLVTGVLLHLYGIAMIVTGARTLVLVAWVDEAAPVLALQRRVAALRAWRIREGRWFGIVGCFMWVALVIWGFGLLGVDIVARSPGYIAWQLLTALVCLGVFAVVTRLDKAPEGSAVRRAHERLAEIERFETGA